MSRPVRRRVAEAGFTLVETIVAMFVISVAVVGMIGAFAAAERSAAAAVTQAQAEALMRQVTDALRQPSAYVPCANTSSYTVPTGASIVAVQVQPVGTVTGGGATAAHYDCSHSAALVSGTCPNGDTCDYGVQRVQVQVTYSNGTLSRVVFAGSY